jgi:hypothetical protein
MLGELAFDHVVATVAQVCSSSKLKLVQYASNECLWKKVATTEGPQPREARKLLFFRTFFRSSKYQYF